MAARSVSRLPDASSSYLLLTCSAHHRDRFPTPRPSSTLTEFEPVPTVHDAELAVAADESETESLVEDDCRTILVVHAQLVGWHSGVQHGLAKSGHELPADAGATTLRGDRQVGQLGLPRVVGPFVGAMAAWEDEPQR